MIRWLCRKTLFAMLSLFVATTLTFVLMKSIPGNPFMQDQALPKEIYAALQRHYGLDKPIWEQFWLFLKNLINLDFGPSLIYKNYTVNTIISDSFPTSLVLGMEALLIAITVGLFLGILGALHHGDWRDKTVSTIAIIGISMPSFIIATCLQYVIAIQLGWLPIARWGTFSQSILPAISLALLPSAFIARLTRAKLINEMRQEYIKTVRAKGMPEHIVVMRHALRSAILPVVSYIGPLAANIFTGSFIIEKIYSIPGLGFWFVNSVLNRDYPVIMGITIFYSFLILATSLLVDIIYAYLDPRVKAGLHKGGRT